MWPSATKMLAEKIKQKKAKPPKSLKEQLKDWRNMRHVLPFILLFLLLMLESLAITLVQTQYVYGDMHEPEYNNRFDICIDARPYSNSSVDFGLAFYFITTVHTSIGYGDTHPCTVAGKLITIISSILGVPLTLLCIGLIGRNLAYIFNWLWRRRKKNHADQDLDIFGREKPLPLWIGLIIVCVYLLLFSFYFYINVLYSMGDDPWLNNNWTFFDSIYFTVTSLFTIGLGDYTPNGKFCYPLTFVLTLLGVSMFSMCITLTIQSMESQFQKVVHMIQELYDADSDTGETDTPSRPSTADGNRSEVVPREERREHKKVAKVVLELWNRDPAGKWLTPLLMVPPPNESEENDWPKKTDNAQLHDQHNQNNNISSLQHQVAAKWKLNSKKLKQAEPRPTQTSDQSCQTDPRDNHLFEHPFSNRNSRDSKVSLEVAAKIRSQNSSPGSQC